MTLSDLEVQHVIIGTRLTYAQISLHVDHYANLIPSLPAAEATQLQTQRSYERRAMMITTWSKRVAETEWATYLAFAGEALTDLRRRDTQLFERYDARYRTPAPDANDLRLWHFVRKPGVTLTHVQDYLADIIAQYEKTIRICPIYDSDYPVGLPLIPVLDS